MQLYYKECYGIIWLVSYKKHNQISVGQQLKLHWAGAICEGQEASYLLEIHRTIDFANFSILKKQEIHLILI